MESCNWLAVWGSCSLMFVRILLNVFIDTAVSSSSASVSVLNTVFLAIYFDRSSP